MPLETTNTEEVSEQKQEKSLNDYCNEYQELRANLGERTRELKDLKERHNKFGDYEKAKESAKKLRLEIDSDSAVNEIKDDVEYIKERKKTVANMILSKMEYDQLSFFKHGTGEFKVIKDLAYQKTKKEKINN
jgi:predicted  nucleic acid-binding Zn-ribbon protein